MSHTLATPPQASYSLTTSRGHQIEVSRFDQIEYQASYDAMSKFAVEREADAPDQIWLLEHPPVYTQGTACEVGALLPSDIPIVKTDRGGQITYHGPGQIVMYPLVNLRRHSLGVKRFVDKIEQCMVDVLTAMDIDCVRRADAPGVYVDDAKIGALGLRVRRGSSYHGLSLNVDMDLKPFSNIDPCGFQGLAVTQIADYISAPDKAKIATDLAAALADSL